jgi:hypothetical protein
MQFEEDSQLGKLINLITGKMVHKGKNCSIKLRKYYFCTTTQKEANRFINLVFLPCITVKRNPYQ